MRANAVFTIFALDFILFLHFFCTLLALSEFAENQIFPTVARAPNILAYVYLYTGICLSWALKPATSMQ